LEFCGDGILQSLLGEQCDDGCLQGIPYVCESIDDGDGCDQFCQVEQIIVPEFSTIGVIIALAAIGLGLVVIIKKRR
jgi:hypothetical protein